MAALQNFSLLAGDDETVTFTVDQTSGIDIRLSGMLIEWKVFLQDNGVVSNETPLISKTLTDGIVIVPSPEGFVVTIARADTLGLLGNYYHEAKVIDGLGDYTTVTQGIMTVLEAQ